MNSVVRVTAIQLKNLKNVKKGKFMTNSNFQNGGKSDVIGIYGQNGSGKTAVIEAFKLLKSALTEDEFPKLTTYLIYDKEDYAEVVIDFIIKNKYGEFFVTYTLGLGRGKERYIVVNESITYRENEKNKRVKILVSKENENIIIRTKKINDLAEKYKVPLLVAERMASKNATSFVFRPELKEVLDPFLNNIEKEVMMNLINDFEQNFHVIDEVYHGLLVANIVMPFNIHLNDARGSLPYEMNDTMVFPIHIFNSFKSVIDQINIVLNELIPGLTVKVNNRNTETMDDGAEGVRFELLSKRGNSELPLRCESSGILKVISILSTLIAVYNNPNALVVIDELDAGVFEYLLGEILDILSTDGKGQLIFTSHNLRVLEVLPVANMWFTTANEEVRYIQLKGVKQLSNPRDIYLRAVQLGGQEEELYKETDSYNIKTSFRKAGLINGKTE
jgi:AAA15 family ATPase/GTPase